MDQPHAIAERRRQAAPPSTWRDALIARALTKYFSSGVSGRLDVILPSGRQIILGEQQNIPARITMHSYKPLWRLSTRGAIGLAESYMRAEIDTPDLRDVLRFCVRNYATLERAGSGMIRPAFTDIFWHKRRDNSLKGSRRNIAAHYDLGNAFYALWLDSGMTYSSAVYRDRDTSLAAAQDEKYRLVLDALDIKPGGKILEIGCGWGGLAERATGRGAHVTGLTLSAEQLAYARERARQAGFADKAEFRFEDYRLTSGSYDGIASVEMIEAVGEAHWPLYFAKLAECLKPGGAAVIQAITIDEPFFESYRRQTDFIQRYIFPGGMLPTVTRMQQEARRAGLSFETIERFGASYSRTLEVWRQKFRENWPEIKALSFDERFRRMWDYYLTYCEVGFENGDIDVGIYRMTKPTS